MLSSKLCRNLRSVSLESFMKLKTTVCRKLLKPDVHGIRFVTQSRTDESQKWIADYRRYWNNLKFNGYDISRSFICFKHLRLIKAAIRESGPIVEENEKLKFFLKSASNNDLPTDFIEFVKRISVEVRAKVGLYEMQLASGCHFIIKYEDIDPSITKHHLLELCDRHDAALIQGDIKWPQCFEQKGLLSVRCETESFINNLDKAEEIASKIGAEVVCEETDPEGIPYWKFYCAPHAVPEIKRNLQKMVNSIEEAYVGYIPKSRILLPTHMKNNVYSLIVELSKVPTIDNVFDNVLLTE